jgi:hypothetical protein
LEAIEQSGDNLDSGSYRWVEPQSLTSLNETCHSIAGVGNPSLLARKNEILNTEVDRTSFFDYLIGLDDCRVWEAC